MNIYEVAKKSFFSKLFVFAMVSGMSFATVVLPLLIPITAQAQATLGTPPSGWKVVPTTTTFNRVTYIPGGEGGDVSVETPEQMDFIRGSLGMTTFADLSASGNPGYVAKALNAITQAQTGLVHNAEDVYTITTMVQPGDVKITNYYVGQTLIATARPDGLYLPPRDLLKLQSRTTDSVNDLNTEAGINNWFDTRDGRIPGVTNSAVRSRDNGNIDGLQQEQQNLESQITAKRAELLAAANDPAKKAQLQGELDTLEQQLTSAKQNLQAARATGNANINTAKCDEHWYSIITLDCMTALIAVLANMYLKLVSFALGLVGTLFDFSIELAVNSAEFIDRIAVVEPIWAFIRDMLNMTFIFILLWIAAHIILGKKNYTIRSNVVKVVIVAILINFSLFAAKLLVDGSNLLTLQIYEATRGGTAQNKPSISAHIMNTLGMPTMYKFGDIADTRTIEGCGSANGTIITIAIFGSIFMIILGLAFLLGAVLFFTRMANIIYLFITSPLWVWGYIMDTSVFKKRRESWEAKMSQVVKFPVIYMMFIFVGVFAFVKLLGLRSNDQLSFLTLFCVAEDKSLIGQLPLILNFCLVIWVMLSAIRYGVANSSGPEGASGSSLGFTKKFNDSVSKRFGKWAENTWRKPIDFSAGAGRAALGAGKAGLRYAGSGASNLASRGAGRVAQDANTPTLIRDLAARMSTATKDPKIFGKTQKQASKEFAEWREGKKTGATTKNTIDVALESVGDAPKFDPEKDSSKADMERKASDFANKVSKVFFKKRILDDNGNREAILAAARAGVTEEKDADGNTTYKFNQAQMRQKIEDIRKDHMPGNNKGNRIHTGISSMNPYDLLFKGRTAAREKAITAKASSMVSSDGKAQGKKDDSPEALKAELKKYEDDLKKYPTTPEQLDVLISTNPDALKGIGSVKKIKQHEKDIEEKKAKLAALESVTEGFDEYGEIQKDHTGISKLKNEIERKKEDIDKAKKAIMAQRAKIQKTINATNKKLEPKEKGDSKK